MTKLNESQRELVENNLGLAKKFANDHYSIVRRFIEEEDFIQEMSIGLMKASTTYDSSKGSFSTHAYNCMKHELALIIRYNKSTKRNTENISMISLDTPITIDGIDSDMSIKDTIQDKTKDIESEFISKIMIDYSFNRLGKVQKSIVKTIKDHPEMNYKQISEVMGVSRTYVSMTMKALRSMYNKYMCN